MRYFVAILPPADLKPGDVSEGLMYAMGPWMEKSVANGTLISTGGLTGPENGKRLNGRSGKVVTTDRPFAEAKEVVGGYAVIEAPDQDAAVAIAAQFLQLHIDNGLPNMTLEVRAIEGGVNY
jgi:hypothetical protein